MAHIKATGNGVMEFLLHLWEMFPMLVVYLRVWSRPILLTKIPTLSSANLLEFVGFVTKNGKPMRQIVILSAFYVHILLEIYKK